MKNIIKWILIFGSISNPSLSFAKDKLFVFLKPKDQIPLNTFIYTVMNVRNGSVSFGYSPTDPSQWSENPRKRRTLMKIPGHVAVMLKASGISQKKFMKNPMLHVPKLGRGQYVGGGFVMTNSKTIVHPLFSNKSAGVLLPSLAPKGTHLMNPKAPIVNRLHPAMLHQEYLERIYQGIVNRTGKPIEIETRYQDSPYFQWNTQKQGPITQWAIDKYNAAMLPAMQNAAKRINLRFSEYRIARKIAEFYGDAPEDIFYPDDVNDPHLEDPMKWNDVKGRWDRAKRQWDAPVDAYLGGWKPTPPPIPVPSRSQRLRSRINHIGLQTAYMGNRFNNINNTLAGSPAMIASNFLSGQAIEGFTDGYFPSDSENPYRDRFSHGLMSKIFGQADTPTKVGAYWWYAVTGRQLIDP